MYSAERGEKIGQKNELSNLHIPTNKYVRLNSQGN